MHCCGVCILLKQKYNAALRYSHLFHTCTDGCRLAAVQASMAAAKDSARPGNMMSTALGAQTSVNTCENQELEIFY